MNAQGKRGSHRATASRAVLAAIVGIWVAAPTAAQTLRGSVRDAETGGPVALAYVGLLVPGEEMLVATLADAEGRFSVTAPRAGSYLLYVARSGYSPMMDGLFDLGDDGVLDLQVGLKPSPFELDSLAVVVEPVRRDLASVGFYERKAIGLGHFIERDEIETTAVDDLVDAFRNVPSLTVVTPRPSAVTLEGVLNPRIRVRQATGFCSPTLYVDANMVEIGSTPNRERDVRPDDFVDPAEVEAVEIYTSPAEIPLGFNSPGGCGVVLIWTRLR